MANTAQRYRPGLPVYSAASPALAWHSTVEAEASCLPDGGVLVEFTVTPFEDAIEPVDLVFDTVGGERLERSRAVLAPAGRLVAVAEQGNDADYFVVEHDGEQLQRLADLAGSGELSVAIDSVLPFARFREAFTP